MTTWKIICLVIAAFLVVGLVALNAAPFLFPCDDLEHIEPNDLIDE